MNKFRTQFDTATFAHVTVNISMYYKNTLVYIFNFAKNIGHGFQIKDDFLDIFGSEDKIGKSLHSDKKNNKKNYIHLLGKRRTEEKLVKYHENALKNLHQIDSYENNPEIYALTDFIFKREK